MKNVTLFVGLYGLIGWAGSCTTRQQDANVALPQGECRLLREVSTVQAPTTSTANGYTQNSETTYTYDDAGNLTRSLRSATQQSGNGATNTSTQTTTYAYDGNGFLLRMVLQIVDRTTARNGTTSHREDTQTTEYAYASNRLTRQITTATYPTTGGGTQNVITTAAYEYDGAGNVAKRTSTTTYDPALPGLANNVQTVYAYQNGRLVDVVTLIGTTETRTSTIENGLIVKTINPDGYSTSRYDARGRLVQGEQYRGSRLLASYTLEWADGRLPNAPLPPFKGHPDLRPEGERTSYLKKFTNNLDQTGTGTVTLYSETAVAAQLNAQGYVTEATTQHTAYGANGRPTDSSTTKTTYTYADCR